MTEQVSWEDVRMDMAIALGQRSRCSRAQYGCVIEDIQRRVVGEGYNGPPATWPYGGPCAGRDMLHHDAWCRRGVEGPEDDTRLSYTDCPAIHAEANALLNCTRRPDGATLYVSGLCCFNCVKLIANSGVVTIVMLGEEGKDYRSMGETYAFLQKCNINWRIMRR